MMQFDSFFPHTCLVGLFGGWGFLFWFFLFVFFWGFFEVHFASFKKKIHCYNF